MRHFLSLLAGVAVAPLTWVLIALGQGGSSETIAAWVDAGRFNSANLIEPAVYLAIGGILLGLIATLRISPLGPLFAGLLLITPYVALFATPFRVRDAVPDNWRVFGDPLPLHLPLDNGTLFFLGSMLVIATFSAKRWRRWPTPVLLPPPPYQPLPPDRTDDAPTLTDWNPTGPPDNDAPTPNLGYPPPPPPPAATETPWSSPPRRD